MAYVVERATRAIRLPRLTFQGSLELVMARCAIAASFLFILLLIVGL